MVSVVLEVAQVTKGAQRRGPWPGQGWQEGFLEEVTSEEGFGSEQGLGCLAEVVVCAKKLGETMAHLCGSGT